MRYLLPLLLLAAVVDGRGWFAPKVASPNRRGGSTSKKSFSMIAKKSKPVASSKIDTSELSKLPSIFAKIVAKSALFSFVGGYGAGIVVSLKGLIQEALDGKNGFKDLHERSYEYGNKAAKWYTTAVAVMFPVVVALLPTVQSQVDKLAEKGTIDAEQYRVLSHHMDDIKKNYGLDKE